MKSVVPDALADERLDRAVATLFGLSRRAVADAIEAGRVLHAGAPATTRSSRVRAGEVVVIDDAVFAAPPLPNADPGIDVDVRFADEDVIVVSKPAGLVVHPGAGQVDSTLVNGLLARFPEIASVGEPERPGIVQRLDRGTTGLMVVARSESARASLVEQLRSRTLNRRYVALVWGELGDAEGVIDAPIGRSRHNATRMTVTPRGRDARTAYRRLGVSSDVRVSLVGCRLETGRTHQIRVHLRAIGHPVVGDRRYDGHRPGTAIDRPALHAGHIAFEHPATGEMIAFTCALPDDLVGQAEAFGIVLDAVEGFWTEGG